MRGVIFTWTEVTLAFAIEGVQLWLTKSEWLASVGSEKMVQTRLIVILIQVADLQINSIAIERGSEKRVEKASGACYEF